MKPSPIKELKFSLNNLNGIRIPILIYGYSLVFVIVGGSSILPNLVKLKRIKRSFFVLAPEGIVFRRIWGGIRAYSWKELDLTVHMFKRRSMFAFTPKYLQFNIALPNCAELFFKPKNYTHKEFVSYEKTQTSSYRTRNMKHVFLSESEKRIMNLIETAFNYYCDLGKLDLEEQLEAYMRFKRKV